MDDVLLNLPGVVSIADDITVCGNDEAEHDHNLHKLMKRAQEKGLVFNKDKCQIKQKEVPFFGNIYRESGVRPDPSKVQAINDLTVPTNVNELQQFLGMITYLAPYICNLSEHTVPLHKLLQKDVEFRWHHEHDSAFTTLKEMIKIAGTLSYFDVSKPVVIQVDASQEALGVALVQEGHIIAFVSKSLTETEKRYANIELELLACVFGAERFHTCIYGKQFKIESDHKTLEIICKKNLTAAPARLQRMLLRVLRYDYSIVHRPGKEMVLADCLSRPPKNRTNNNAKVNLNMKICHVQFSNEKLDALRKATENDVLNTLMKYTIHGFPEKTTRHS